MIGQDWAAQAGLAVEPWQREFLDHALEPGRSLFVAPRRASGPKLHAALEDLQRLAPRGPVLTPEQVEGVAEAGRVVAEVMREFGEQLARTFADVEPILRNVLGALPDVDRAPPLDPRQRALEARRARSTGPARPRLDGRRAR